MITQAPPSRSAPPSEHPFAAPSSEVQTAPLPALSETIVDSLPLLDHRSRRRAIPVNLAPPGPYLALQDGDHEMLIPIEARIAHIGRGSAADLRFEDARVSRRHAIVVRYGRHVRMLDDRSSSGTFVNGRRIIAIDLSDGDVVRLGPVAFRYLVIS